MSQSVVPELLSEVIRNAERIMTLIDRHELATEDEARTIRSAILWHFIVIGEASTRLGMPFHQEHAAIPWRDIIDQRNVIAHGYDAIDWNLLFALRKDALPSLIAEANKVLKLYPPPSEP